MVVFILEMILPGAILTHRWRHSPIQPCVSALISLLKCHVRRAKVKRMENKTPPRCRRRNR